MIQRVLVLAAFAAIPVACGVDTTEDTGQARATITQVPNDVHCVQVVVIGDHTVTRLFDVVPGASSVLEMKALPLGTDTFKGSAFKEACSSVTMTSIPTWTGDDVTATVAPGVVTDVKLTLRRGGQASVSVDFQDADGGLICPTGLTPCNGVCVDTSVDPNNCGACGNACEAQDTCNGGSCVCTDDGTACQGRVCGTTVNNCGQPVSCGNCAPGGHCCVESCVCPTCECP